MTNETEAPELLPCPFCGELLIPTQSGDGFTHNRRLKGAKECFISWLVVRRPHHIEWNTRADLYDAQAKRIEELDAECDETLNQLDSERHSVSALERRNGELLARIAELEARLATCSRNATKYANDCVELEAKLAKAVAHIEFSIMAHDHSAYDIPKLARATIAELKGTD